MSKFCSGHVTSDKCVRLERNDARGQTMHRTLIKCIEILIWFWGKREIRCVFLYSNTILAVSPFGHNYLLSKITVKWADDCVKILTRVDLSFLIHTQKMPTANLTAISIQ